MPTAIVEVIVSARRGFEAKRKKATLYDRNTDMEVKLVLARTFRDMMREQPAVVERRIKAFKM